MKRITTLWVLPIIISLSGCITPRIKMPWDVEPYNPYSAGYHSGCEAKRKKGQYDSSNEKIPARYQAEYSLGFSDGYALCEYGTKESTSSVTSFPPKNDDKQNDKYQTKAQKDCKEKRRLCFPGR